MNNSNDLETIFSDAEKAFRNDNEELFKQHWTSEGYNDSLVPNSGLSGSRLFQQGAGKGWFPQPNFSKNISQGKVMIVQTELWSWKKEKSVRFRPVSGTNKPD